jgi:hypothetical protein
LIAEEEKMDIDVPGPSSQRLSASKHASLPAEDPLPKAKRAKLSLPPDQLGTVYNELEQESRLRMWSTLFKTAADAADASQMRYLMLSVLRVIKRLLSRTDLNEAELNGVLAGFTADEINEFEDGLRKGLVDKNWADLVAHRTFQFPP